MSSSLADMRRVSTAVAPDMLGGRLEGRVISGSCD